MSRTRGKGACYLIGRRDGKHVTPRVTLHNDPPPRSTKELMEWMTEQGLKNLQLYKLTECPTCSEKAVEVSDVTIIPSDAH